MLHDQMKSIKVLAIIVFIIGSVVESLRLSKVVVPPIKKIGESAVLLCPYELERDTVYAVKWYKDHEEIFRYVPKYNPQMNEFRVEGVHIRMSESNPKQVSLHSLDLRSTGVYRCEVSAEGPSFASVQGEERMTVVHLPAEGPQISGSRLFEEYEVGDLLELNCTSSESFPPARLSWFINDIPINPSYIKTIYPPPNESSLNSMTVTKSISQMSMRLELNHLEGGSAKVRCVAHVFALFWQDGDEKIVSNSKDKTGFDLRTTYNLPIVDNRETLFLVKGGGSANHGNLLILLSTIGLLWFYTR